MRVPRRFFTRLSNFVAGRRSAERLREEMELHLAALTEENIRAGMSPGESRRYACVKFGAAEAVRAACHAETGLPFVEDLLRDVRYALRVLRKSPAFTLVASGTLMLAIGANIVVFGVLNAVLLHPLEVSAPGNLYQLRLKQWTSFKLLTTSYPVFEDYRRRNTAFSGIAGFFGYAQATLRTGKAVLSVSGYAVTGNYFDLLGVRPEVGRFIHESDERGPNSAPYLVLSDSLWRRAFNADPGVVGTTVRLYNQPYTIVGVAPARFHGTEQVVWPDYWIPLLNYFKPDYPVFEDYRRRNTAFSGIAGFFGYAQATLRTGKAVLSVSGYAVTGNYFDLLGVRPEVGRFIHESDERGPNSAPYLVLSDSLWRRAFNADPGVVGTTVRLYNQPYTIVGVAPARFHGTEQVVWPDYWIPLLNYFKPDYLRSRTAVAMTVLGRLKPGVTPQQATENLNAIALQLGKEHPETDGGLPLRLIRPGLYGDSGDVVREFLYGVAGLALLVLAAACANLASLFAARAADRNRELALRIALGASRWRLVRQLMTEAMVVSLIGGAVGLAAAGLLLDGLNRHAWPYLAQSPSNHLTFGVDARVYLAALILSLGSGLLFGMIPARQVGQSSPLQALKGGPVDSMPLGGFALRDLLLGVQIAICTLLVTASFVAVRGMVRMLHTPLGFHPQGVMLAEIDLSDAPGGGVPLEKKQAMIDALRSIPGVTAAGTLNKVPFTGGLRGVPVFSPGTTEFKLNNAVLAPYMFTMSPGYLEAAGTRLLGGRDVSWHDTTRTPAVAVVNATFARKMWGEAPALGQHFIVSDRLTEVVGVAEDGKYYEMQESAQPVVYLPLSQNEQADTVFVVRSQRARREMAAALERTLSAVEPNAPITVQSWSDALGGALFAPRAAAVAVGVMGILAGMLAVTGIFGLAAYNVSRRMKEFGIRVALGARKLHVLGAAVGKPLGLLAIGSLAGLLLSIATSRLLAHVIYQANPQDPVVVGGVVLSMALLGVVASAVPALRALAVDPSKLLREE